MKGQTLALLCSSLLLFGCASSTPPDPPQPSGDRVPINPPQCPEGTRAVPGASQPCASALITPPPANRGVEQPSTGKGETPAPGAKPISAAPLAEEKKQ